MASLYELGSELDKVVFEVQTLLDSGADPNSVEVQELLQKMVENEADWDKKAINVGKFLRQMELDQEQIKSEIERLTKKLKSSLNTSQSLHDLLLFQMNSFGKKEIKTPILSIKVRDNPLSVFIENEDAVPPEYKTEKTTVSVNKNKLKLAFKSGEQISGVNFVNSQRLDIK